MGTGLTYGRLQLSEADANKDVSIVLDPSAIAAVQALAGGGGVFALGGSLEDACQMCRPPQNLRASCGSAFRDWSANGFAQLRSCTNRNAIVSPLNGHCGVSPVRSEFNFRFTWNTSVSASARFETLDGSCTSDYCYDIQNFDLTYYTTKVPTCWSRIRSFEPRSPTWGESTRFFQSGPRSAGLDLTAPWPSFDDDGIDYFFVNSAIPTRRDLVVNYLVSPFLDLQKSQRITFWLKLLNLEMWQTGMLEFVTFSLVDEFGFTYDLDANAFVKCPPTFSTPPDLRYTFWTGSFGWTGSIECTVEIDMSKVVIFLTHFSTNS